MSGSGAGGARDRWLAEHSDVGGWPAPQWMLDAAAAALPDPAQATGRDVAAGAARLLHALCDGVPAVPDGGPQC